jgi:transposase-like protein
MKKRHSEKQIIRILRDAESHEVPIGEVCQQHNISEQRFYRWRDKYGGMEVADARLLKELKRKTPSQRLAPRKLCRQLQGSTRRATQTESQHCRIADLAKTCDVHPWLRVYAQAHPL